MKNLLLLLSAFVLFSCIDEIERDELSVIQVLDSKIDSVQCNLNNNLNKDNNIQLAYSPENPDELEVQFSWHRPSIPLHTFGLSIWLDQESYICNLDYEELILKNDTIIERKINLTELTYCSSDDGEYNWDEFLERMIASKQIVIEGGLTDNTLAENPLLSSFGRFSNRIIIYLHD